MKNVTQFASRKVTSVNIYILLVQFDDGGARHVALANSPDPLIIMHKHFPKARKRTWADMEQLVGQAPQGETPMSLDELLATTTQNPFSFNVYIKTRNGREFYSDTLHSPSSLIDRVMRFRARRTNPGDRLHISIDDVDNNTLAKLTADFPQEGK